MERRPDRPRTRNTDSAGQLEDLNNLIEAGVDAIVLNPSETPTR